MTGLWRVKLAAIAVLAVAALLSLGAVAGAKLAHTRHGTIAFTPPAPHRHIGMAGVNGLTFEEEIQQLREEEEAHGPMANGGGPVMKSDTSYLIVWKPAGTTFPARYVRQTEEYLRNIGAYPGGTRTARTNTESVLAQYGVKQDYYGGTIIDRAPFPASGCTQGTICLTDEQLQREIERVVAQQGLPADLSRQYHLLLPVQVQDCFESTAESGCSWNGVSGEFCEYHSAVEGGGGRDLIYSVEPYVPGCAFPGWQPQGEASSSNLDGLSHEHSEMATDPLPPTGWTGSEEWEIGDICSYNYGTPIGETPGHQKFGQIINGMVYATQMEWSNRAGRCVQHG